jgi:poly [ADP-ribose] polymerase
MNLGEKKDTKQVDVDSGDYAPSKLHPQVQDFVKLIYNKNLMELAVAANGYDIKKLPLGDLSAETIQKGYEVLSEIEKAINKKQTALLRDLCGKFYTYIPHNFGRQKMENFIIDNEDKLKDKQELI